MNQAHRIDLGLPALLEFRGPDAVRFLNGQVTQDVRRVVGSDLALPSCITDAKGKLQFRVWIHARGEALVIEGPPGSGEALEARLTRYLIADEVEVADLSGRWRLHHITAEGITAPAGGFIRRSRRYQLDGSDCWIPAELAENASSGFPVLDGDALESFRIAQGVPVWGRELDDGLLPPEAGLDASDISYQKGCYIGQEVISRIKSAGKVNKRLMRLGFDAALPTDRLELVDAEGKAGGELCSVAPLAAGGTRHDLAFLRRGVERVWLRTPDGVTHTVEAAAPA